MEQIKTWAEWDKTLTDEEVALLASGEPAENVRPEALVVCVRDGEVVVDNR